MRSDSGLALLEQEIEARNRRLGLTEAVCKMDHALDYLRPFYAAHGRRVLFVGVGQGHDALHALLHGAVDSVVGVDPYFDDDGNGDEDYRALLSLIERLGVGERFEVHKQTLQEFAADNGPAMAGACSMAVIPFTMHHVFETREPLGRSQLLAPATAFFAEVRRMLEPGGVLALVETARHGLRPLLKRAGLLKGPVGYASKQDMGQWRRAVEPAGFALVRHQVYTPYALRSLRPLLDTPLGLWGPCDRYHSFYKAV